MTSFPKLLFFLLALAFDSVVPVNATGKPPAAVSAVSASYSTPSTSSQGLCHYADALEELERELISSETTSIMRHQPRVNQHYNDQYKNLFGDELVVFQQKIAQRKIHRKEYQQQENIRM